jgi:hypothetical protein
MIYDPECEEKLEIIATTIDDSLDPSRSETHDHHYSDIGTDEFIYEREVYLDDSLFLRICDIEESETYENFFIKRYSRNMENLTREYREDRREGEEYEEDTKSEIK